VSEQPASGAQPAVAIPRDWIVPDWAGPDHVRAFVTTRHGGVSEGAWGAGGQGGMNLGVGTGDREANVARNRALLNDYLPSPPRWLALQHGSEVVQAESVGATAPAADASTAVQHHVVCAVTVADCLPVLLTDRSGSVVAAAHAGWRGVAAGILQATVIAMRRRAAAPIGEIQAFLGPAIGPGAFEVGAEVLAAMRRTLPEAEAAFRPIASGKFQADLPQLARQALLQAGVTRIYGGHWCTVSEPLRFYSFRRDRVTGRHAAVIWLEPR